MNIKEIFDKYIDEYLEFDRVKNKLSSRSDLHAFILLDSIYPSNYNIISYVSYDQIWFNINMEELALTEEHVCELVRCGVMYDENEDRLFMFI